MNMYRLQVDIIINITINCFNYIPNINNFQQLSTTLNNKTSMKIVKNSSSLMRSSSHGEIHIVLDSILTKGGQQLYQNYINDKLPSDCNDKVVSNLQHTFGTMLSNKPERGVISVVREVMPAPASIDTGMPNKIKIGFRTRSQSQGQLPDYGVSQVKTAMNTIDSERKSRQRDSLYDTNRPRCCFKNSCVKGERDYKEEEIRINKIREDKNKCKINEQQIKQQQKNARRSCLQSKINELLVQGIPYAYDDEGNYIIPDVKNYKKQLQKQSKKKVPKPFGLRYKALQLCSQNVQMPCSSKLAGRARGYSSVKTQRKKKINEQQFTNKHQRQNSAIPFMDLSAGVKIVQKQRNIMAQKIRQQFLNRQQYKKQTEKTFFKSFLPSDCLFGNSSNFKLSSDRPATHMGCRDGRKSLVLSSSASCLTYNRNGRPKTSKQLNKITITNRQLAVQMVKQDSFLLRKIM